MLSGAEGVLIVNIGVALVFATGYAILAIANPTQRLALGFAANYLIGMIAPLADLAGPRLGAPVITEWVSYLSFLLATLSISITYPIFHGAKAPWRAMLAVLVIGVLSRANLSLEPSDTLAYGLAYHTPFALAAILGARTVLTLKAGSRALTLALACVFSLIAGNEFAKALFAMALGSGRTLVTYVQSAYALVSQASSGILLLAAGLLLLVLVAQKAITESQIASETDPLSGLLNRRGFDRLALALVAEAQAARRPVSAAMLDLDHFKLVNDHNGHAVGDEVIAAAAAIFQAAAPDGALVGRMGGEEFALVLQGLSATEARWRIEHLRSQLAGLPEHLPRVTASAGLAQLRPGETLSDLMRRADIAAYEAKRAGRDRLRVSGEGVSEEDGGGRSSAFLG